LPSQSPHHVLVVLGAHAAPANIGPDLHFDSVIAVDRGIDHALALGLTIAEAVGDFDSASALGLRAAEASGAKIQRHNPRKDSTDLEIGLDTALSQGATKITIIGGYDDTRLDHQIANLLLLSDPRYAEVDITALINSARVFVIRDSKTFSTTPSELVTLLALGGPARGITTSGLEYPLTDDTLTSSSSRGVSNVASGKEASVGLTSGVLMAVLPGAES
jgi:thiamine pyrophosphokinase